MHLYTPRLIEPLCRAALEAQKILVLIGARQTGKSTLSIALLANVAEELVGDELPAKVAAAAEEAGTPVLWLNARWSWRSPGWTRRRAPSSSRRTA